MPSPFTISIEPHFGRNKRIWRRNRSEDFCFFFLEITTISGQNSEFGDKVKVKTFFLKVATISGQNSEFGDEIEVKTFFFFRDHCDGERKNGESEHSQE